MKKWRIQTFPILIFWWAVDLSDKNLNFTILQGVQGFLKIFMSPLEGPDITPTFISSSTPLGCQKPPQNSFNEQIWADCTAILSWVSFYVQWVRGPQQKLWFYALIRYASSNKRDSRMYPNSHKSKHSRLDYWLACDHQTWNNIEEMPHFTLRKTFHLTLGKISCDQSLSNIICRIYYCEGDLGWFGCKSCAFQCGPHAERFLATSSMLKVNVDSCKSPKLFRKHGKGITVAV